MSDRPEIEIQRQTAFGKDGQLEVTETCVETSLEDQQTLTGDDAAMRCLFND